MFRFCLLFRAALPFSCPRFFRTSPFTTGWSKAQRHCQLLHLLSMTPRNLSLLCESFSNPRPSPIESPLPVLDMRILEVRITLYRTVHLKFFYWRFLFSLRPSHLVYVTPSPLYYPLVFFLYYPLFAAGFVTSLFSSRLIDRFSPILLSRSSFLIFFRDPGSLFSSPYLGELCFTSSSGCLINSDSSPSSN